MAEPEAILDELVTIREGAGIVSAAKAKSR